MCISAVRVDTVFRVSKDVFTGSDRAMASFEYAFLAQRLRAYNAGSFVPLYIQLADQISRLIQEQGDMAVGRALPSEAECAKAFAVSRPTVRQAMDRLLSQGLIKRQKGRGTFVTRPRLAHDVTHDFDDEMRLAAHRVSYEVLDWIPIAPPAEARLAFAPLAFAEIQLLRRLRAVDGKVVGIEERFIPALLASRIALDRLETQSIFELMRQADAEPIAHIDVEVSGRIADPEASRLMGLEAGAPLLVRASTFRSAAGDALVHGKVTFAADQYTFRFTVNFSGPTGAREGSDRQSPSSKKRSL